MRLFPCLLPAAMLALAACGKSPVAMPADPIDRAATCAVIAATAMRAESKNMGALGFDQQGEILHYALLEGARGESFDQTKTAAVVRRMTELEPEITKGEWKPLVAQCRTAYPEAQTSGTAALPADGLDARLGCYALNSFLTASLQNADAEYADQLNAYMAYRRGEDAPVARALEAAGIRSDEAKEDRRKQALATIVKSGPPTAIMQTCMTTYAPE